MIQTILEILFWASALAFVTIAAVHAFNTNEEQ